MGNCELRPVKARNIDVDIGIRDPVFTIDNLLKLTREAIHRQDYTCAQDYLERASNSAKGMLHYAAYLMNHLPEHMEEAQRVKIEHMLLFVECNSPAEGPKARAMLIDFYQRFSNRPLRRLGYMLRASRMGEPADKQIIKALFRGIAGPEIAQPGNDMFGAYLFGTECAYYPNDAMHRWARIFLSAVAESESPHAGLAALQLADLLQEDGATNQEITYWLKRASECGNPDVLKKENGGKI